MRRTELEASVLDGPRAHLMEPALFALFCEEYTHHLNALRMEASASFASQRAELGKVTREIERVIQAILDGVPGSQVKEKMAALDGRKAQLESLLASAQEPPALLHPKLADHYRREVTKLHEALTDETHCADAVAIIRSLIDHIALTPVDDGGRETLAIDLRGDLAGILSLAAETKKPPVKGGFSESMKLVAGRRSALNRLPESIKLVAGARFDLTTFRL